MLFHLLMYSLVDPSFCSGDQTHYLGVSGRCSDQLSYLARAYAAAFLKNHYCILFFTLPFSPLMPAFPPAITTLLSMSPFFFFAQSLHPSTSPHPHWLSLQLLDSKLHLQNLFTSQVTSSVWEELVRTSSSNKPELQRPPHCYGDV